MTLRTPALLLLLAALAVGAAGCKKRTAQAAPPVDTAPAPAAPEAQPPEEAASSEARPEVRPEPVTPEPAKPQPTAPAPRPASPPAANSAPQPAVAPPRISPRLSPAEQAEYERKTSEAIGIAERNLESTHGKRLNAAQDDMVQKIRGFLGQSREAVRAGDWVRALNLAQKAQVLSVELVGSL